MKKYLCYYSTHEKTDAFFQVEAPDDEAARIAFDAEIERLHLTEFVYPESVVIFDILPIN